MASLLKKLFGGSGRGEAAADAPAAEATEYNGFSIHPAPRRQGSTWLTAGRITKAFPDGVKEHEYIRADTYADRDDAIAFCIQKAKQIIDEQGDRIFDRREPAPPPTKDA
jgi:hypothetical protein